MQPTMQHFSKPVSITTLAIILLIVSGTGFRSQAQDEAPRPPRSRADETLEMWNAIGCAGSASIISREQTSRGEAPHHTTSPA